MSKNRITSIINAFGVESGNVHATDEWLNDGYFMPAVNEFNRGLTEWLEEYNFLRPHQTLDYQTPIEYFEDILRKQQKLLPMYSASAFYFGS